MYKVTVHVQTDGWKLPLDMRVSHWVFKYWANQWFDIVSDATFVTEVTLKRKKWFRDEWVIIKKYKRDN